MTDLMHEGLREQMAGAKWSARGFDVRGYDGPGDYVYLFHGGSEAKWLAARLNEAAELRAAIEKLATRAARPVLYPPDERWYAIEIPADEWEELLRVATDK